MVLRTNRQIQEDGLLLVLTVCASQHDQDLFIMLLYALG